MEVTTNPFLEDEQLGTAWTEWEQHRKEKKQKLTPLSVKKQLKFLLEFNRTKEEIIAIINQSIMNGWTGLFELKTNGKATNKNTQHVAGLANHFAETYGKVFTSGGNGQGPSPDAK